MPVQKALFNKYSDLDYFTVAQAVLYIGDVWVDEVTAISYTTRQNKIPLYGYASQLFDTTAAGQVLVQGNFSINYKEQGYLWVVLRRWFGITAGETGIGEEIEDTQAMKKWGAIMEGRLGENTSGYGGRPMVGSNKTLFSRAGIERLMQGAATKKERYNFYHSMAGYASSYKRDTTFEDVVEVFEDQLWKTTDNDILLQQIRRTDDNMFDGFDIYVVFGNMANPRANHTAQKIIGVRLLDQGKVISIGDAFPVQEMYSFIARAVA